ncbi:amidase [Paractinoplanes rishiriensis]|uniref:Amidase n=1 Tax=Paractinoplanes rishiriensis TaxID=1050105 RepID=A0A919JYS5_9ACTN|nr:amidase [Actinoplanes rishiriensis]GIE95704.1 amidase [Actinoplanes rishiriensis]
MTGELWRADATDLAAQLRRREVSAREVVAAHLDRIAAVNPRVNAIVTLDPDGALRAAAEADERLAAGAEAGLLHGLPIAFKDTHLTRGMRTTFGSPLYAEHVPDRDTLCVTRIERAGAIRIGKTNVPEFAAGSHTFNPVFGATRNPYDLDRSAGGSSGGAAAALATGMQPIADGSDMGGSLRNPASFCNVTGFRPTPGRVPVWPADAPWDTLATPGPLARTVADVALLLSVMAGPDPRSPIALDAPFHADLDRDLTGLRIGYSPTLGGLPVDPEVLAVLAAAEPVFTGMGCHVEEAGPDLSEAGFVFRTLRAHQFANGFGADYDAHPAAFKATLAGNIEDGRRLTRDDLSRAEQARARVWQAGLDFFDRYDALLAPVSQVPPFPVGWEYPYRVAGEPQHTYLDWMRSCYLVTVLGAPALSVPAGFTPAGLPVGLQIVTRPRSDLLTLQIGAAFEAATRHGRRWPDPARTAPAAGRRC